MSGWAIAVLCVCSFIRQWGGAWAWVGNAGVIYFVGWLIGGAIEQAVKAEARRGRK